jgi:hypothetical protein
MNAIMWQRVVSINNRCANFNISEHLMIKNCHRITASISLKLYGPRAAIKLLLVCVISNLNPSQILRSAYWYLPTFRYNMSFLAFNGHVVPDDISHGADGLSRNVGTKSTLRNTPEERRTFF